jgi:hypothetical protein
MTITSYARGHLIVYKQGEWRYQDTGDPATPTGELDGTARPCPRCGRMPTIEGYDACRGYVPGASSVCCGHGVEQPYVVWEAQDERASSNRCWARAHYDAGADHGSVRFLPV